MLLARHPHVLDRLVAEIDAEEDAYLDAVAKEVLRVAAAAGRHPLPPVSSSTAVIRALHSGVASAHLSALTAQG